MQESTDLEGCMKLARSLGDYVAHELTPDEEAELSEHLRMCEECLRRFHFEKSLVSLMREKAQALAAPPSLRARLQRALQDAER